MENSKAFKKFHHNGKDRRVDVVDLGKKESDLAYVLGQPWQKIHLLSSSYSH